MYATAPHETEQIQSRALLQGVLWSVDGVECELIPCMAMGMCTEGQSHGGPSAGAAATNGAVATSRVKASTATPTLCKRPSSNMAAKIGAGIPLFKAEQSHDHS